MSLRGFWEAMKAPDGMRQIAAKMGDGSWRWDAEKRAERDAVAAERKRLEARIRELEGRT